LSPTGEAGKRSAQRANGERSRRLPRLRLGGPGFARAGTTRLDECKRRRRAQRANGERSGVARASPGPGPQD
jgi:hypothetical protein